MLEQRRHFNAEEIQMVANITVVAQGRLAGNLPRSRAPQSGGLPMTKPVPRRVFVTGASGYMGRALVPVLVERGQQVTALVRPGSEKKLDGRCEIFLGNALDGDSYVAKLRECDTFIHLVGVPHPSPAKAQEFVAIDRKAA